MVEIVCYIYICHLT